MGRFALGAPADHAQQQLLQRQADELLGPKGGVLPPLQLLHQQIVQRGAESLPCLPHDGGDQVALFIARTGNAPLKKGHGGALAVKAHHHHAGRAGAGSPQAVEFVGRMKDHLPLFHQMLFVTGDGNDLALVHIYKFPEIVAFARKGEIRPILKVMH